KVTVALFLFLAVLFPATAMGLLFPTALARKEDSERATPIGALYALNTVTSILGCLLAGYFFVDRLGSGMTLTLVALLLLALLWKVHEGPGLRAITTVAFALALPFSFRPPG